MDLVGTIGQEKIFSKIESFKLELFDWSRLGTNNEILRDFLFGLMRRDPKQRFEMAEVLDVLREVELVAETVDSVWSQSLADRDYNNLKITNSYMELIIKLIII